MNDVERLPLRQRNKVRIRAAIRSSAMELIESNGYASTTVEQIADAAQVSPSTFFRYFSSKESVLISTDIDLAAVDALASQPADIPTMQAVRQALEETRAAISDEEWELERRRRLLALSIPELRYAHYNDHGRTAAAMSAAECRRLGRDPDDFEIRVFFGALVGALRTALSGSSNMPQNLLRALDFVEAGMPLRGPRTRDP